MRQHAEDMDASNGPTFTYYSNWDADMIYGCECDEGFTGYDCSQQKCPTGDDPLTTGQVNEKQIFECHKSSGDASFVVLYFTGFPTIALSANALVSDVRSVLEVQRWSPTPHYCDSERRHCLT